MNKIIYYKQNDYDNKHFHFPFDFCGYFHDGHNINPIFMQLMGEIIFETNFNGDIVNADKEFLKATNNKKIPNNVICYLE